MAQDPAVEEKATTKVLFVVSGITAMADKQGKELKQTGWYLPEVAHPYALWKAEGYDMTFASINGGETQCDFSSYQIMCLGDKPDPTCVEFVDILRASDANETKSMSKEEKAKAVDCVKGAIGRDESGDAKDRKINKIVLNTVSITSLQGKEGDFDIVFFAGGHGTCWDFYDSNPAHDTPAKKDTRHMHAFAAKVYENKEKPGVVSAVCHGVLALVDLKLSDGTILVKDKTITGFTNKEEEEAQMTDVIPVLQEDELIKNGAKFNGAANWSCNAFADQGVVTGQNPQSAGECAKLVIQELANRRKK